jgi:hypothetical protein
MLSEMPAAITGVRTVAIVRYFSDQSRYIVGGQDLSNLTDVSNHELKIICVCEILLSFE